RSQTAIHPPGGIGVSAATRCHATAAGASTSIGAARPARCAARRNICRRRGPHPAGTTTPTSPPGPPPPRAAPPPPPPTHPPTPQQRLPPPARPHQHRHRRRGAVIHPQPYRPPRHRRQSYHRGSTPPPTYLRLWITGVAPASSASPDHHTLGTLATSMYPH